MTDRIDRDRFLRALEYARRKGDNSDPVHTKDNLAEAIPEGLDLLNYLQWHRESIGLRTSTGWELKDISDNVMKELERLYDIRDRREDERIQRR